MQSNGSHTSKILIFDTTLRDGEQSPGSSMTDVEKLRLAHQLDRLGVDVLEAGFPVSSPDDERAVRSIAREVRRPIVAALARAAPRDIDLAARALEAANRPRLHVFLATSDVHLQHKLAFTREQCLEAIGESVRRARRLVDDVEFSAEDATRTDRAFLIRAVQTAVDAGATTINLPDTVGYACPEEYACLIRSIRSSVVGIEGCIVSVHCHDDLGLAVANSLAGVTAGARQVECTVNGIGERAGNAALEEVVMALHVRRDIMSFQTGIVTAELFPTSRLLAAITGVRPQPNKAVVGQNAFAHEAGIHQAGMLRHHNTYEIMRPETVGVPQSSLVLGRHSGRHAVANRCRELGCELDDDALRRVYDRVIEVAGQKKRILDEDLLAIIHAGSVSEPYQPYELIGLDVQCGGDNATATVTVSDTVYPSQTATASGDGPLAASFAALDQILDARVVLEDLTIRAATPGRDALAEVTIHATIEGKSFAGRGAATDIVLAAVRAYLHAVNKAVGLGVLQGTSVERHHDFWGV